MKILHGKFEQIRMHLLFGARYARWLVIRNTTLHITLIINN